jgi:hypothetical protein
VNDIGGSDDKRTAINWGPIDGRQAADVFAAFARWLKLFELNPHKTLS